MSFTEWKTIKYVKHVADVVMAAMVRGQQRVRWKWKFMNIVKQVEYRDKYWMIQHVHKHNTFKCERDERII